MRGLWALGILLLAVGAGCVPANPATAIDSARTDLVEGVRPLAAALDLVEQQTGVPVSYEDPVYVFVGDLEPFAPAAAAPEAEAAERPQGFGASDLVLPRRGGIDFDLGSASKREIDRIVQGLLERHAARQNPGRFRMSVVAGHRIVSPREVKDARGEWRSQGSPLDATITLRGGEWQLDDLIDEVLKRTAEATGIPIEGGLLPLNLLAQQRLSLGGGEQAARAILAACLAAMRQQGWDISWRLLYDPNLRTYFFNLETLEDGAAAAPAPRCEELSDCSFPRQGETSEYRGWGKIKGVDLAAFGGRLQPASPSFAGAKVTEDPPASATNVKDTCHFPGSAVRRFRLTGGTWKILANHRYLQDDLIGYKTNLNRYYSQYGKTHCYMQLTQHMKIRCNGRSCEYAANVLRIDVGEKCSTIARAAAQQPEPSCP